DPGLSSTFIEAELKGEDVPAIARDIWVVFQDSKGAYWFGSNTKGAFRLAEGTITHFSTKDGLAGDSVREILEDEDGNIYLSTLNGISRFDGRRFSSLSPVNDDPEAWKLNPSDLWFKGSYAGGPYRYDGKKLYACKLPRHPMEAAYYSRFPNTSINPYEIYTLYKDRKGHIWFGTGALGIYRFDGTSFGYLNETHHTDIKNGGSFGIRSILQDSNGEYWFCNTKYKYRILPETNASALLQPMLFKEIAGPDVTGNPLGGDRIYFQTIIEAANGDLWMQTYQGGIWQYSNNVLILHPVSNAAGTVNVISMYKDKNGILWLATEDEGPYRFDGAHFVAFNP
ncbi:MAG: hypothetical protein EOP49_34860, partial [Sphingobacteriales bacterium]